MNGKIRWGILGLGNIAKKFAADLKLVENAELLAVGSRDITKAKAFAAEFSASKAYGSYQELVEDPHIDVIYVATPHSHHYENVLLCLNNSKAVLCEKAFAVNSRQAEEMIKLAREKDIFLMEALWTKFLPHHKKLMQLLSEGLIGDVRSVLINFGFRPRTPVPARLFDPALAGGTLLDIGIYNVFTAVSVLGNPDSIDAHITPSASGIDEQCAILFKYNNGAMAQLFSSFVSDLPTEAEINGTKGRIKLTTRFYAPESTIEFYPGRTDTLQKIPFEKDSEGFGYQYEIRHVNECLLKGLKESPVISLNETLQRTQLLDAIRKKAGIVYPED
ncbi:MAG: Gfo/Idh/MocA family oxidoreductase [Chitinophagaceae bacterium]|nr:Gfo/Idh/MocA family oxidoreductase [Chitinophagaceae bacterium]